jgi:Uncharacterised protein from bacillus cereus group
MTWAVISIILVSLFKILMTCLPTGPVEWLIRKFEIHSKLSSENVTVTIDGNPLEGEDKILVIEYFNQALFLKQQFVYPGTEESFLRPESNETPIVIDTKRGKQDVRLFLYPYKNRVDVVKQYEKKIVAYSVLSDSLQKRSFSGNNCLTEA